MNSIIAKIRDLVGDNYIYTTEVQEYLSSRIFTLQNANIDSTSLTVYKNGILWLITPVAGTGGTWTRALTIVTITKTAHGLITGDSITVTASNDVTALPLGTFIVTKLTANTFTVVGLNAGASSGTCTYTVVANYSYSSTTGKVTITGNLTAGDSLEFDYNAYERYSDNELRAYIRSAIYRLVANKYKTFSVNPPTTIFPSPSEAEKDLIAIIATTLIKGTIRSYKTPEFSITFADNLSTDESIKLLITQFKVVYGNIVYIDPSDEIAVEEEN
jgi:hypothetical protein